MSNPVVDKVEEVVKTEAKKPVTVPLWVFVASVMVAFVAGLLV